MKWISTKTPPKIVEEFGGRNNKMYGQSAQVLLFNGRMHIGYRYRSGTWASYEGEALEKVTHWRELPEPPRKGKP